MLRRNEILLGTKCNEKSDVARTYGRYLNALNRLHEAQGGLVLSLPICRLPAGGPSNFFVTREDDELDDEAALERFSKLPGSSRAKRQTCVLFDENDPIAALEESFGLISDSTSASTQPVFVQHNGTQTEEVFPLPILRPARYSQFNESREGTVDQRPNALLLDKNKDQYYYTGNHMLPSRNATTSTGTDALRHPKHQNVLQKLGFWRRSLVAHPPTNTVLSEKDLGLKNRREANVSAGTGRSYVIERQENSLTQRTKPIIIEKETQYEEQPSRTYNNSNPRSIEDQTEKTDNYQTEKSYNYQAVKTEQPVMAEQPECARCKIIPQICNRLCNLQLKVEKQDARMRRLREVVKLLCMRINSLEDAKTTSKSLTTKDRVQEATHSNANAPNTQMRNQEDSESWMSKWMNMNMGSSKAPDNKGPVGFIKICDPTTETDNRKAEKLKTVAPPKPSRKSITAYSSIDSFRSCTCNIGAQSNTDTYSNTQAPISKFSSQSIAESQVSSVCQFCSQMQLPVLDSLVGEVLKLIGNRPYTEFMLNVLLRPDNVYHVSVQERDSKRVLGCLLVSSVAIREATKAGFFDQILTYSVTDVRNTIKQPNRPVGIPFEFVPKKGRIDRNPIIVDSGRSRDAKALQFISKVLNFQGLSLN